MKTFTLEVSIESKADGGDTVVSGKACAVYESEQRNFTSGKRLTAAQKRGGVTLSSAEQEVAANLAKMACKAAT